MSEPNEPKRFRISRESIEFQLVAPPAVSPEQSDHENELKRLRYELERRQLYEEQLRREILLERQQLQQEREMERQRLYKQEVERQRLQQEQEAERQRLQQEQEAEKQKIIAENQKLQQEIAQNNKQQEIIDARTNKQECGTDFQDVLNRVNTFQKNCVYGTSRPHIGHDLFHYRIQDRNEPFSQVATLLIQNFQSRRSSDHKKHNILLIPGGSGIGKTRFAQEIPHQMSHQRISHQNGYALLDRSEQRKLRRACRHMLYLHIDLKRGYEVDSFLDLAPATLRMGVRLLARFLEKCHHEIASLGIRMFCALTTKRVIEYMVQQHRIRQDLRKQNTVIVVLHIDEFQLYEMDLQAKRIVQNESEARAHWKEMMDAIGQVMVSHSTECGDYVILPVVTGTAAYELGFLPSQYAANMITLLPLTETGALRMADERYSHFSEWPIWRRSREFLLALSETGYIPHFVEMLLMYNRPIVGWSEAMINALISRHEHILHPATYYRMYNLDAYLGSGVARFLLLLCLAQLPAPRNLLLCDDKHVLQDVESYGSLFTRPHDITPDLNRLEQTQEQRQPWVTIHIPFILMKRINDLLPDPVLDATFFTCVTERRPWTWQNIEAFHSHFLRLRWEALAHWVDRRYATYQQRVTDAQVAIQKYDMVLQHAQNITSKHTVTYLIEQIQEENRQHVRAAQCAENIRMLLDAGWTLDDLLPHALGATQSIQTRYRLTPRTCWTEAKQCLHNKKSQLNMEPDMEIECLNVDGKTIIRRNLLEGIFRCCPNNYLFDERVVLNSIHAKDRPLLILVQTKHTDQSTTLYTKQCLKWYKNAVAATVDCALHFEIVYVLFTNRKLGQSRDLSLESLLTQCPRLILLTREQLTRYLGQTMGLRAMFATPSCQEKITTQEEEDISVENDDDEDEDEDQDEDENENENENEDQDENENENEGEDQNASM